VQGVTVLETSAVAFSLWYEPQVDHPAFEVLASRTSKIQDAMLFWADQSGVGIITKLLVDTAAAGNIN
jgi:hypothetical protein